MAKLVIFCELVIVIEFWISPSRDPGNVAQLTETSWTHRDSKSHRQRLLEVYWITDTKTFKLSCFILRVIFVQRVSSTDSRIMIIFSKLRKIQNTYCSLIYSSIQYLPSMYMYTYYRCSMREICFLVWCVFRDRGKQQRKEYGTWLAKQGSINGFMPGSKQLGCREGKKRS